MKSWPTALMLLMGFASTGRSFAQSYSFSVIKTPVAQTIDTRPYSITDSGSALTQIYNNGVLATYLIKGSNSTQLILNGSDDVASYSNSGWLLGTWIISPSRYELYLQDPTGNFHTIASPNQDTLSLASVNNSGTAVGLAKSATGQDYGFVFTNGTVTPYTYPGSTGCTLNAIDTAGDLAGTYFKDNDHGQFYAFFSSKGKNKQITVNGCIDPNPAGINDAKKIVGSALWQTRSGLRLVGFVANASSGANEIIDYSNSAPKSLAGPNGPAALVPSLSKTQVYGINNSGQIVGQFSGTYQSGSWSQTLYIPFLGTPTKGRQISKLQVQK